MDNERPSIIDRKYKIVQELGGGGFSEVYLVEGPTGECALKLLKEVSSSTGQSALDEFKNEFAVLKNLNHPHIARILDFGFDDDMARYYYTSEMIRGNTIYQATHGKKIGAITDLIVQSLRALEYLHSFHIYHFDIKAANVLVVPTPLPTVKLIDFGLAGIDPRGRLIGTPSYMSPEIVSREMVDWRADLYSLGVLWYFCLARFNPFRSKDPKETLRNQLRMEPNPPSTFNEDIPPWIDDIVIKMLAKNPAKRFSHAARILQEINRYSSKKYPLETRETLVSYLPQEGELIGRKKEMELIDAELDSLVEGKSRFRAVLVEGSLGSGKTRLLREFKYAAQLDDIRVQLTNATDFASFSDWCESLSKHISEGEGLEIFILDDVEGLSGDVKTYQDFIGLLSRARRPAGDARVMMLLANAKQDEENPFIRSLHTSIPTMIELKNFSPGELTTYLASLTGLDKPPQDLVKGIYSRTEGNPMFVTEVLKALITGGGLFDEGGRWRPSVFEDVGVDFTKVTIPTTVEELLLNRAVTLNPEQRSLLEALSVVGQGSSGEQLARFTKIKNPFPALRELVRHDFIERTEEHMFVFRNELLGSTLYASLSDEKRKEYHDRVATSLLEEGASDDVVAHHLVYGSDPTKALKAASCLGDLFLKRGQGKIAARYFERAVGMIPPGDVESRVDMLLKHGTSLLISMDYKAAESRFIEVQRLLPLLPDTERSALLSIETLVRLGGTFLKLLSFDRARAAFTDAKVKLHTKVADPVKEIHVENFLGAVLMSEGRYREAKELFERTRKSWRELSFEDRAKITNNDLGMVFMALRELKAARETYVEDLKFFEELGDDMMISRACYNIAQLNVMERRFDESIEMYKRCIELCKKSENTELLLRAYNGLGNVFQVKGNWNESIAYYERGLALHQRIGDLRGGAAISVNIGIIESERNNYDAAMDALVPTIEFLKGMPDKTAADWVALARGLLELGDVQRKMGELESASETLSQAYDIAVSHESVADQRFWILSTMVEVAMVKEDEKQIVSLLSQMRPIARSEDEMNRLQEIERQLSSDRPSISISASESTSMKEAAEKPTPYEKVLEINKLINAERDLEHVLRTVIYYAMELSGADSGAIILMDEDRKLRIAAQRNMDGRDEDLIFSKTLASRVLDGGKAIVTDNAATDERFSSEESVIAHQLSSVMCLPIYAKDKVVGVLYLDHKFAVGAFSKVDMKVLEAFADQAGLAIENARLVDRLSMREKSLKAELSTASVKIERYEKMLSGGEVPVSKIDYGLLATESGAMRDALKILDKVADTDISVLLVGESGVGKELIAKALHDNHSRRGGGRFVAINCGAIPHNLMESELFGYKAGAFTGANKDKKGLIEEASGGTLFFDEIGELDPALQVKLLRVLQEKEFVPVGATRPIGCDVRVISATNRNVDRMVKEGNLRDDLFYRLCQVKILIPPLRKRVEDIPALAKKFVEDASEERELVIQPALMKRLVEYPWPGNVRELQNLIHVACALTERNSITMDSIPSTSAFAQYFAGRTPGTEISISGPPISTRAIPVEAIAIDEQNSYDPNKSWRDYQRIIVAKAYRANRYHANNTAAELGLASATMYKKIGEWNLRDHSNPIYGEPFVYVRGRKLEEYIPMIFRAALHSAKNQPMRAIANLHVSQGYFYKVMKRFR